MSDSARRAWFPLDDPGLRDFYDVYEANYDALLERSMAAARAHPGLGRILAAMPPEMIAAENQASRQRLKRAVEEGTWEEYELTLRQQGGAYAQMGLTMRDWSDFVTSLQRELLPSLLAAFPGDMKRLAAAIGAMQTLLDRSMNAIAEQYIATKEALIHEQRRLVERSEERYQMLFDNGPVPMWVYDAETLRFLAVNRAFVEHYGYSESELLESMTIEQIRFPEDIALLHAEGRRDKQLRSSTHLGEWRHRKKDGTAIFVELRLETFIFLGRKAHLIVANDVTERKKAAQALAASEERYRSLVAATTSMVWSADPAGHFVAPQPAWDAYTGQTFDQQRELGWLDAILEGDRQSCAAAWARAVKDMAPLDVEARLYHAQSGKYRWCEVRAVPLPDGAGGAREWIGTVTDIEDQKRAAEPGRFFSLTLDLLCIAGMDGFFKRLNPAFATLGWTEEELLARPFLDFVHPDDRTATLAEMDKLGKGETTLHFENRYQCKDGSYRHLVWSSVPDVSGLLYSAAHDITDRKRIDAERIELNRLLTQRNEELTRASRAKSDFLAMMSHELRTPLNSIIGFSEVLLDGKFGQLNERQGRYLNNVLHSGRHLLGLINDLLDLSKIEAGRMEVLLRPCDALGIASEALGTLQPIADGRGVQLVIEPEAMPQVSADVARFKQVLYNLLSNAIKFTPTGGRVRVWARHNEADKRVRVFVRDTGPGISPEDLERLFTPFVQLDNARGRGGTGLGLALTRQLVELMGGRIDVESRLGDGSTFFVDLPVHAGAAAPAPRPSTSPSRLPLALVVDDDAAARELLVLSLQENGYQTLTAGTGHEAMVMARQSHPDVITLDIQLPGIDGWDVLRLLKSERETADIPVVMISISSDRAKTYSLGAIEHLVKPVARETLLEVLARREFTARAHEGPINVLAIDDEPKQLELFRAALEPHGFHVQTESSGKAGVAAAQTGAVDLVLLDLMMPDMSGIEVVEALRADERTAALPILLVTAHELDAAERARLNGDVEAVLSKGEARIEDLVGEIARVMRRPTAVHHP